jgi:ferredoxin-NADP reductase
VRLRAPPTLVLEVTDWPGHLAGQHIDVRLTAPDGYQAARSYSLVAPTNGERIEITVQLVPEGEVSSYLADEARTGDTVEVRGPVGGWFVWQPADSAPVLLVAGGSGVVPLMAMIRSRDGVSPPPFRLIYSVRTPEDRIYDHELHSRAAQDSGRDITFLLHAHGARWRNAPGRTDNRGESPHVRLAA